MQNAQATTNSRSNHSKILSILIGFCCVLAIAAAVASLVMADPFYKRCLGKSMWITHAVEFDAVVTYAQQHGGYLPAANHWEESLYPHKNTADADADVTVPTMFWERPRRLAMNAALSSRNINTLKHPDKAILFYESVSQQHDASDNASSLPLCDARGGMSIATGFADGHVEEVPCTYRASVLKESFAALSAPVVDVFPHNKTPPRKTKMRSILVHLRLGMAERAVHRRVGRADEGITSPLSMAGWTYDTDAYRYADGTLWVEYADSPPTREPDTARVTCISGPTFDIGRCRP